jgi:hypothetical protein
MKKNVPDTESASAKIDERIKELGDWRGKTLAKLRRLIKEADPQIVEEWKWMIPVWSHNGIVCTGETYKSAVKLTFANGASLKDPSRLFNSSLDGGTRRAIDIREDDRMNEAALKRLISAAVALNLEGKKKKVGPREIPIPRDLVMALREDGVLADWESMPPGRRLHLVKWIDQAAQETTRAKRVTRAVEEAHQRREKRVDRARPAR